MSPRCYSSFYRAVLAAALLFSPIAGCQSAMSQSEPRQKAPNDYPLTFVRHSFDAYCYNAIGCRVIYDNFDFSLYPEGGDPDTYVSPSPKTPDYRKNFYASYIVMRNLQTQGFPTPVEVRWKSLDGVPHETRIDLGEVFKGRKVLHNVPESDYAERSFGGDVHIILEVNDRTINIYMKAHVATRTEQVPGNKHSHHRTDLILAWSRTY